MKALRLVTMFVLVSLSALALFPSGAAAASPCDSMQLRVSVSKTFIRTAKGNWPAVLASPQVPTGIPAGYRVLYATYFQGQSGVPSQVIRGAFKPFDASDEAYWRAGLGSPGVAYFTATLQQLVGTRWVSFCSCFAAVHYTVYPGGLVLQDGIFQPNPGGRGSIVGR